MTPDPQPPARTHLRLLAGHSKGEPVFEVLPALFLEPGLFELAGSPGLTLGCAAGDVLRVGDDGRFTVVEPGGNLCVQAAGHGCFAPDSFAELRDAIGELGDIAEAPSDLRFVVVTVALTAGFPAVEHVMDRWAAGIDGAEWWFGNTAHDEPVDAAH